ncbi:MAG: hypothetical protein QNJ92_12845 [Alphaproteobacteria bacterium]|nr:hypothetical protein [Alphaproteobacteria bacterium]
MKILIPIDIDPCVRHFIQSGAFVDLAARHDVTFLFPEGHERFTIDPASLDLPGPHTCIAGRDDRFSLWKHLRYAGIFAPHMDPRRRRLRPIFSQFVSPRGRLFHTVTGLPGIYGLYRQSIKRRLDAVPPVEMEAVIDRLDPDLIVHPTVIDGCFVHDLLAIAKRRGIPSVLVMNSWDNAATKWPLHTKPDYLLVWGQQSFEHAQHFLDIPAHRVIKFGAAQLDVFRSPPASDPQGFRANYGFRADQRVLLYAGSTSQNDEFAHLRQLDEAVSDGRLGGVKIIYRPHPWGLGGRDGGRILKHEFSHIELDRSMRAYFEYIERGQRRLFLADYRDAHDLLCNVDAVISPLSTMILEGAMHGKPALAYVPDDETLGRALKFKRKHVHFDEIFDMPEFLVAEGSANFIPCAQKLVARSGDGDWAKRMRKAGEYFVSSFEEPFGHRLLALAESIVHEDLAQRTKAA